MKSPLTSLVALLLAWSVGFAPGSHAAISGKVSADTLAPPNEEETKIQANDVDPAATAVLEKMENSYRDLKSAEMKGNVEINLDFPGTAEATNQAFTSSYEAPNRFKHDMTNGLVLGSDGDKGFVYDKQAKSYARFDFPMSKLPVDQLPPLVPHILQVRNPSLLFALSDKPFQQLAKNFDEVKKVDDVKINGTNYTALQFGSGKESGQITMLVDPKTQLIRRFTVDFKPALKEAGKRNVNAAMLVVDYASVKPNASISDQDFNWTPPEEATDIREAAGAQRQEKQTKAELEGTVAPNFTLTSLDGKIVSLYDLRGQVVVLDFWATWCGPCVMSLPKLDDVAKEEKGSDVKFFAINVGEEKPEVQSFVDKKKLGLPVLLDENGNTAKLFGVDAIPKTVVVGKDGIVKKVFTGYSPENDKELKAAIESARTKAK